MTPAEMEAARADLVKALVYRLRNHDPDTDPLGADAEPFAEEFATALLGFGWRPVLSRPPDWRQRTTRRGSADPEVMAALLRGDIAEARRLQGTASVVPVQRTAEDNEEEER